LLTWCFRTHASRWIRRTRCRKTRSLSEDWYLASRTERCLVRFYIPRLPCGHRWRRMRHADKGCSVCLSVSLSCCAMMIRGRLFQLHRERCCGVLEDLGFHEEDTAEGVVRGCLTWVA
jgi:hypothetical protein